MRILVITDKLYPDECGGSCTVACETIKEWQKENDVDIFTIKPTKTSNDKLFNGNVYRQLNKKNVLKSAYKLSKILKYNTYDIILFHSVISWYIYYLSRYFYKNISTTVAVFHGPWGKEAIYKYQGKKEKIKEIILPKLMRILEKRYIATNQNFIFLSKYMKSELQDIDNKLQIKNNFIIPGGIRLENYKRNYEKKEAKQILNINYEKKVIFILRRLDKRMGIDDAIRAFSQIEDKESYEFIIGGKGAYLGKLKELANELKIKVRFEGFIPDEKINMYFCATDLFLVPSKDLEGFGLVNLESLAMGVPVLARPQGGMKELKNLFDNFYLVNDMSIENMKEKMKKLSEKFKNKIINEPNIKNYDWTKIADSYIEIFERIQKNEI